MSDHGLPVRYIKESSGQRLEPKHWVPYIAWEDLRKWRHWSEFEEWMRGKTCVPQGAYPWDVERFVEIVSRREAR